MRASFRRITTLLALMVLAAPIESLAAELAPGDPAPEFELLGSDGKTYTLATLLDGEGSGGIVLAWFPQAFTTG